MKSTLIFLVILILVIGALFQVDKILYSDTREAGINILLNNIDYNEPEKFTEYKLRGLPDIVKRYIRKSVRKNSQFPNFIRLKQEGFIKPDLSSNWTEVKTEEYISCKRPGFFWSASASIWGFPTLRYTDVFYSQRGLQTSKLFSLIKLKKVEGDEINKSSLFKYISDIPYHPIALLPNSNITWKQMSNNRAKLIYRDAGTSVISIFTFTENADLIKIETDSIAISTNLGQKSYPTAVVYSDYEWFGNYRIPTYIETEWIINESKIKSAKLSISALEYDNYGVFEEEL